MTFYWCLEGMCVQHQKKIRNAKTHDPLFYISTNPLNIQNYMTNITVNMTEVKSSWGSMGRVHKGFWKAMGEPKRRPSTTQQAMHPTAAAATAAAKAMGSDDHVSATATPNGPILRIELINTSVYRTIVSAIQGLGKIIKFLTFNLFYHVKEPIDSSWMGPDTDIRTNSMYTQAEQQILELIHRKSSTTKSSRRRSGLSHGETPKKKKKRLFITGHSLGGAMGTSKYKVQHVFDLDTKWDFV